jgi:hypothetical protein
MCVKIFLKFLMEELFQPEKQFLTHESINYKILHMKTDKICKKLNQRKNIVDNKKRTLKGRRSTPAKRHKSKSPASKGPASDERSGRTQPQNIGLGYLDTKHAKQLTF